MSLDKYNVPKTQQHDLLVFILSRPWNNLQVIFADNMSIFTIQMVRIILSREDISYDVKINIMKPMFDNLDWIQKNRICFDLSKLETATQNGLEKMFANAKNDL